MQRTFVTSKIFCGEWGFCGVKMHLHVNVWSEEMTKFGLFGLFNPYNLKYQHKTLRWSFPDCLIFFVALNVFNSITDNRDKIYQIQFPRAFTLFFENKNETLDWNIPINFFPGQKNHPGHGPRDRVEGYSPVTVQPGGATLPIMGALSWLAIIK